MPSANTQVNADAATRVPSEGPRTAADHNDPFVLFFKWTIAAIGYLVPWSLLALLDQYVRWDESFSGRTHPAWSIWLPISLFALTPISVSIFAPSTARRIRPLVYFGLTVVISAGMFGVLLCFWNGFNLWGPARWLPAPMDIAGAISPPLAAIGDALLRQRAASPARQRQ